MGTAGHFESVEVVVVESISCSLLDTAMVSRVLLTMTVCHQLQVLHPDLCLPFLVLLMVLL
jgi:hypothetical protein